MKAQRANNRNRYVITNRIRVIMELDGHFSRVAFLTKTSAFKALFRLVL